MNFRACLIEAVVNYHIVDNPNPKTSSLGTRIITFFSGSGTHGRDKASSYLTLLDVTGIDKENPAGNDHNGEDFDEIKKNKIIDQILKDLKAPYASYAQKKNNPHKIIDNLGSSKKFRARLLHALVRYFEITELEIREKVSNIQQATTLKPHMFKPKEAYTNGNIKELRFLAMIELVEKKFGSNNKSNNNNVNNNNPHTLNINSNDDPATFSSFLSTSPSRVTNS